MLSPRQFAALKGKPHTTIATWLQKGLIPQAQQIETPSGIAWAIPENAPLPEPKMGRPSKAKADAAPDSAEVAPAKKSGKAKK